MKSQDEQHLDILVILHYVYGGLIALGGCVPLIYVFVGAMFVSGGIPPDSRGQGPPKEMGYFFIAFGLVLSLFLWALAGAIVASGRFLSQRKNWIYCIIIAGLECINMPLGTLLGVFTIIVLVRQSVKELFEGRAVPEAAPNPFDRGSIHVSPRRG
jgi:hypothetical protein